MLLLAGVAGTAFVIIQLERGNYIAMVRQDVEQALYAATDQIQLRFFEAVMVAKNIEHILALQGDIDEVQISEVVEDLLQHNPGVLAVALAPGLEITHSFPQSSTAKAVGLKYWEVPAQMVSVAKAYRTQEPVVDGPVSLVQGGQAYILRYPVFLRNAGSDQRTFWGIISIAITADELLNAQQYDFADAEGFVFALTQDKASHAHVAALQQADALPGQPVVTHFNMLGNGWRALARPKAGWPTYSPQTGILVAVALVIMAGLVAILLAFRRLNMKKANAHALLAEALACINEGFIAFDEKERIVLVNQRYLDYHPEIASAVVKGMSMTKMLRLWVKHGPNNFTPEEGKLWVTQRLKAFRNPGDAFLQTVSGDVCLKVTEARTPHGYTVGVWTDVTAQTQAQAAAEAANREKTDFLNNVSHELRTPLTVISGRASFMRNSDQLPQYKRVNAVLRQDDAQHADVAAAVTEYQDFVGKQGAGIASSAQHMLRLVEELLDWTKLSRGQLKLDLTNSPVDVIAQDVVQDLRPSAEAKGLALTYSGDAAATALVDEVRLRQILYNLVSNAVKFTQTGTVALSVAQDQGTVVFCVSDTGDGIAPESQERVFQRFQQVDGSMTRQNGGLGLGLAISQQLAELQGGTLTLQSALGQGSTFRLTLPRSAEVCQLRRSA